MQGISKKVLKNLIYSANKESVLKLCDEILGVVLAGCGLGYLCKGKIESVCAESLREMEKTALNIASTISVQ